MVHMMADIRSQRLAQRFSQGVFQLLWVLGFVAFAADAHGQTLFAKSDTTPNYTSYRHIEECLTVVIRVTEEQLLRGRTVWTDTLLTSEWKQLDEEGGGVDRDAMEPRPDSAIQAGKACLSGFNADTATFKGVAAALQIVEGLLMVRRDQDAQRFTYRFLDSMRLKPSKAYKDAFQMTLTQYAKSRPLLYAEVKQLHSQLLAAVKGDSLYRSIDADLTLARAARAAHDTVLFKELAWRAIRNNDATPVEERRASPASNIRFNALEALVGEFTQDAGLDSLAKSTLAYNMYRENTVIRRVNGGAPVTANDDVVKPYKIPDLLGDYSYTGTPGASPGRSSASYTEQGAVRPGTFPVKNRLNYIRWRPGFCHPEEGTRTNNDGILKGGRGCGYIQPARLKERYPDFEVIVLTGTYGAVGQAGPLQPADEADTLAKQFLAQHRIPAHLVVETTPFFLAEAPDNRRIDLPTPMMEEIGDQMWYILMRQGWFTDKEGYRIVPMKAPNNEWFDRAYEILKNRPSK